ncbi:MAG: NTP pyrophosphohydrolase [bacterium]|nr:NTP pyrophosphohydrolase [bacterium]
MAHIHTGVGEHDLTASAFIIRTDFEVPKIMLHMHKKLGVFMQFGGHVELNENPWQGLEHELVEESGYELSQLELLQPEDRIISLPDSTVHPQPMCINTHPFHDDSHFHTDIEYAFITDQEPAHAVGEGESQDFGYSSREEIEHLRQDKIREGIRQIVLFMFDVCLPTWERVKLPS